MAPPSSASVNSVEEVYSVMDASGKNAKPVSTGTFLATAVLGIPIILSVAPLSIVYQAGVAAIRAMKTKHHGHLTPIDSGTVVDPKKITPRSKRKYDIVLLGSTGFTGRLAVEHLVQTYGVNKDVKWAMAGRSVSKLKAVQQEVAKQLGDDSVLNVDTVICDTSNVSTMPTLVKDTRCVVTTAGPFEKYGSPVVEFCAKYGTHYVDITGEVNWVQHMMLQWDGTAQQTGAKLVSLCGCDSVPWDLTVMALEKELDKQGETLVTATCLDEFVGEGSGGTIATGLMALDGQTRGAPKHPFDPNLRLPDGSKSPAEAKIDLPMGISKATVGGSRFAKSYCDPFIMAAVNSKVIQRSNALRGVSKDLVYREYGSHPDFKTAFCSYFGFVGFVIALLNPITGYFLRNYFLPRPGEGPSRENRENKFHALITGEGVGSKGTTVQSAMYFPKCVGYTETARMVTESGLALALEEERLPSKAGGFFTPSTGMEQVLLDRLKSTGTYFATKVVKPPVSNI